jgi:hypothetical protein
MIVAFNYLHFYTRRSFTFCRLIVFVIACGISSFVYYSVFEICRLRRFILVILSLLLFLCIASVMCWLRTCFVLPVLHASGDDASIGTGRFVATQAYPGWPLSCGRVAVLDCVPAPAGPVQNGVSGAAAV